MSRINSLVNQGKRIVPDGIYVRALHYKHHHELPNLRRPLKFADKIEWLKIHGRLERYTEYVDKYTVRRFVAEAIGAKHLVPLLGVWQRFDDIDFSKLPNEFVLKASHGCEYNFICTDKCKIDYPKLKATFDRWLSENFYLQERENQYRLCEPRIVCEKYMQDQTGELTDYKIWCSKGIPQIIQVDTDRFTDHRCNLLDVEWRPLEGVTVATFGGASSIPPKPDKLSELLEIAKQLSADFPFVRVDLYVVGGTVYFGELTFTPGSGLVKHEPEEVEIELGRLIDIDAYRPRAIA